VTGPSASGNWVGNTGASVAAGYVGNPSGKPSWGLAKYVWDTFAIPSAILSVTRDGALIAEFMAGGLCKARLDTEWPLFIAAVNAKYTTALTAPHVVMLQVGGVEHINADVSPADFLTDFNSMKTSLETLWGGATPLFMY